MILIGTKSPKNIYFQMTTASFLGRKSVETGAIIFLVSLESFQESHFCENQYYFLS